MNPVTLDHTVTVDPNMLPEEAARALQEAQRVPLPLGLGAAALLLFTGVFLLWKPDLAWELRHMWTVKNGEPTSFYLVSARITGLVLVVLSVVCAVLTAVSQ